MARVIALLGAAWADLAGSRPDTSEKLRDQLSIIQFDRLRERVPILYLVLAMIAVGAGLASQGDFPRFLKFAPPGIILGASILRYIIWVRRRTLVVDGERARSYLRRVIVLTGVLMGIGSLWAVTGFVETAESSRALAVMFIFLSAFACANCLASVPRAAILSLVVGLGPMSLAMVASGDLRMVALAVSVVAVSLLQIRLISSQFEEMARNLALQAELELQANTDALTSLLNRRAFGRILDDRIAQCGAEDVFVLAMLDLDGFKPINDQYGHAAGDSLLIMLASRLRAICDPADPVARIGGDEFAIIIGNPKDCADIKRRIAAITKALAEPYHVHGQKVYVTASIGTARFPEGANTAAGLLDAADAALYGIKLREKPVGAKSDSRASRHTAARAA